MSFVTEARVATPHARKYAIQVGKHWMHNLEVEEDEDIRHITFPKDARGASWAGDARVTLKPEDNVLLCRIEASEPEQRDGLKEAVARHVDRFAFREEPLTYDWQDLPQERD